MRLWVRRQARLPGASRAFALLTGLLAALLLTSCTSQQSNGLAGTMQPLVDDANLLSGAAVFGAPVDDLATPVPYLLAPHPEMKAFILGIGKQRTDTLVRLKTLLRALAEKGYFTDSYLADATQTASQSFVNRRGNCLSYTAMFVVLARMASLDVSFQVADVPPAWTAGSDYLVRRTHINALVENLRIDSADRQEVTVDFDTINNLDRYETKVISDAYANSLFLANLAVRKLQAGDNLTGFKYLREGISLAPRNVDLWINLAAFYATQQAPEQAQAAYLKALEIQPRSRAVHAGLARTYARLKRQALAEHHQERARHYQTLNPYYHFSLAQRALQEANYPRALEAINDALELKRSHGGFHYLKAVTLQQLGDVAGAANSLDRAQELGADSTLLQRYPLSQDS